MKKRFILFSLFLIATVSTWACTNFLVGKKASVDGSTFISYAADSYYLFGALYHYPAAEYPEGTLLDVYEWDSGKYLGKIKQAAKTYNVIGNINEHQVAIGETTFGGRPELVDTTGIMDYGSLMYIALQRSTTAREAIKTIIDLVDEYGYYSSGESFSIADPNEAWILEIVGKGAGSKGTVWVALRLPDDCISAHANQARITNIPFDDKENCMYSPDVVSFAREKGYFDGKDEDFSFSDVYAPLDYSALRICEARVWSFFKSVNQEMNDYISYVKGETKTRMPLWVKPDRKLSVDDLKNMMRDQYEGTEFDMTKGVGAGTFGSKLRHSPLTFQIENLTYGHERPIATQQTGFSFVAQLRNWLPNHVGGILWFGVDDAASSVYIPIFAGTNEVPWCFSEENGSLLDYSETSAFWVFNLVSNLAYGKYLPMMEDVKKKQVEIETKFAKDLPDIEATAMGMSKENAIKYLTSYSVESSEDVTNAWRKLGQFLLVKFLDGNIKLEKDGEFIRNEYNLPPSIIRAGYPDEIKREMAKENPGLRHKTQEELDSLK